MFFTVPPNQIESSGSEILRSPSLSVEENDSSIEKESGLGLTLPSTDEEGGVPPLHCAIREKKERVTLVEMILQIVSIGRMGLKHHAKSSSLP